MKIKLLKLLDLFIGLPAVCLLLSPKRKFNRVASKILFIRPGGIGDAVLLIPAIRSIRRTFSETEIVILAETRNAAVFKLCPDVDAVLRYDRPKELFTTLRSRYDLVIDTEQWHRMSAVVARLINAPMSVGFATNERKKLFTGQVDYSHDDYEVLSFFNLLKPLVGELPVRFDVPFLAVPLAATAAAKNLLSPVANRSFVALFPGGTIIERKWGSARFRELAKLLVDKGYSIIVVGGKEDVRAGEKIIEDLPHSFNHCGKAALPETAAVLKESVLLITGDSGIMHIGYGLGIKIVALFGPGREKKWAPQSKNCVVINKHLPCSPCTTFGYTPQCKKKALCMSAITVEEVFEASMSILGKSD